MDTTAETSSDPLLGVLLESRYRLTALIARGGMATVYRGVDERLDRVVAVKVMHRSLAEDPDFVARFTREARSAARLSAPEVVAVFDQGRDARTGSAYLVMENVAGRTLRDLIRQRGALPADRAVSLMEPVLRALAAAHRAGIVHRDIKPENVLLGDDGRIKVADFGLARAVETSSATATTGLLIGTVAYLAPEQVQLGTADARTDVYAAGVVLWELLTGHPPYDGDSPLSVAYHHVHEDVPRLSTVVPGVPPGLDELVLRATRRDPGLRPADGQAFLTELSGVRSQRGAWDHRPPQTANGSRPMPSGSPAETSGGPAGWYPPPAELDPPTGLDPPAGRHLSGDLGRPGRHDTLIVPRPTPPALPRRRRRRWLLAWMLAVLVLAGAGGGWYVTAGRFTRAPGVLSTPAADAQQKLHGLGFAVTVSPQQRFDEQVPAGQVLAQDPDPGRRLAKHGTITLTVSKGADRRTVPPVAGFTREAAATAITGAGLNVGAVTSAFAPQSTGTVVSSDPPAGQPIRPGTAVALVVSKGPELLPVPRVVSQNQDQAQAALTAAGFVAAVQPVFDDRPIGFVLDQRPDSGTAARGSTVTLTVSKGPDLVVVPDVTTIKRGPAEAALRAAGFKTQVVAIPGPGTVRSQDPGAGSKAKRGSTVTLFVF